MALEAKYEKAWHDLKAELETLASKMPDKSPKKIAVASILFQMTLLEPKATDK